MSNRNKTMKKSIGGKAGALLICAAILFASLLFFAHQLVKYVEAHTPVSTEAPETPLPSSASVTESLKNREKLILNSMVLKSDVLISVRSENGTVPENKSFMLDVLYPSGNIFTYDTLSDGSCLISDLPGGVYTISLRPTVEYYSQMPLTVEISKPATEVSIQNGSSVIDDRGFPVYTYSFETDENGYLLLRDSKESSDVVLVNGGQRDSIYGIRFISPEKFFDEQSISLHTERVELIYSDNTVNELYAINAEPVLYDSGQNSGWQMTDSGLCYVSTNGWKLTGPRRLNGKRYFFDNDGIKASAVGIDVSSFNGKVNWEAAKSQGIDFAIVRIGGRGWGTGKLYKDCFMYDYMVSARKAGIKLGAYFYSTAITPDEAVEEANYVLSRLEGMKLDMPIYFDSEYSGEYPDGRADMLPITKRTTIARTFCETIENAGYKAGVYASQYFFGRTLDYLPLSQYDIWLANYTQDYRLPSFAYPYNMWQYTDSGAVYGLTGGTDINVIF